MSVAKSHESRKALQFAFRSPQHSYRQWPSKPGLELTNSNFVRHCLGKNHQTTAICNNCRRPMPIAFFIVSISIHKCHVDFQDLCQNMSLLKEKTGQICACRIAPLLPALHCRYWFASITGMGALLQSLGCSLDFFLLQHATSWSFSKTQNAMRFGKVTAYHWIEDSEKWMCGAQTSEF